MTIRLADLNDIGELVAMGKRLHEFEGTFEPLLTFSLDEATKRYQGELENSLALLLVGEDKGKAVAYLYAHAERVAYFSTDKLECEIEAIYVEPEYRGQALAQQLIDRCLAWARDKNVFRFKTGIYAQNTVSQSVFRKYGFTPYHGTYTLTLREGV